MQHEITHLHAALGRTGREGQHLVGSTIKGCSVDGLRIINGGFNARLQGIDGRGIIGQLGGRDANNHGRNVDAPGSRHLHLLGEGVHIRRQAGEQDSAGIELLLLDIGSDLVEDALQARQLLHDHVDRHFMDRDAHSLPPLFCAAIAWAAD